MNKQIEEMAKVMCGHDCEECAKETASWRGCSLEKAREEECLIKEEARKLYEQGYRKIDEGSVVLTTAKIAEYEKGLRERWEKEIEQARKETAREILQRFYNYLPPKEKDSFEIKKSSFEDVKKAVLQFHNSLNDDIREFAKQYGVEIEQ